MAAACHRCVLSALGQMCSTHNHVVHLQIVQLLVLCTEQVKRRCNSCTCTHPCIVHCKGSSLSSLAPAVATALAPRQGSDTKLAKQAAVALRHSRLDPACLQKAVCFTLVSMSLVGKQSPAVLVLLPWCCQLCLSWQLSDVCCQSCFNLVLLILQPSLHKVSAERKLPVDHHWSR